MSISDDLKGAYRGSTLLAISAVSSRHVARDGKVTTPVQAVGLLRLDDGRHVVNFWPGVTGYESYYLETLMGAVGEHQRSYRPNQDEHGVFGKLLDEETLKGLRPWGLCAGSHVYAELYTTYEEIERLVELWGHHLEKH